MEEGERFTELGDEQRFEIELDDIKHLLIPPPQDPLSHRPMEYLGQSAVERLMHIHRPSRRRGSSRLALVLRMPADKVTPQTAEEAKAMIRKYGERVIKDNDGRLRRIRRKGLRMVPYSLAILVACTTLGILFSSEQLLEQNTVIWSAISEGFYIIGWVALWGPIDTLLFEPVDVKKESELLRLLMSMDIQVVPQ